MREAIVEQVRGIQPVDDLEADHQQAVIAWINSGAELFRVESPDMPPRHLVSYFVVIDPTSHKLLLHHHKKSGLLLPHGGHVDPDEDPVETVRRECKEELGIDAEFLHQPQPFFVTITMTNDQKGAHTDVSLWFLLRGKESAELTLEHDKSGGTEWWSVADILNDSVERFDPNMHRFCKKLLSEVL